MCRTWWEAIGPSRRATLTRIIDETRASINQHCEAMRARLKWLTGQYSNLQYASSRGVHFPQLNYIQTNRQISSRMPNGKEHRWTHPSLVFQKVGDHRGKSLIPQAKGFSGYTAAIEVELLVITSRQTWEVLSQMKAIGSHGGVSRSATPTLRYIIPPTYQAMDVKEFGGALFNEYFINETHAILILESCYGGPRNWSSTQWTKDESATKILARILVPMCSQTCSAIHRQLPRTQEPRSWRRDLPTVEGECSANGPMPPTDPEEREGANGSMPRTAPEEPETITRSSSPTHNVVNPSSVTTANQSPQPFTGLLVYRAQTDVLAQAALNIYVRFIADAINILLYAKISGFSGIRPWSVVAECLFDSWLLMELLLLIGYYAAPRNRPEDGAEIEYSDTLTAEGNDITPNTEASSLTPLFVDVSISFIAVYYGIGLGRVIGSFCWGMLAWHFDHSLDYLIIAPFNITLSIPHPFFFLVTIVAIVPMIVWVLGLQIMLLFAMAVFIGLPGFYSLVFAVTFGACKRLTQRYHRTFRISDSTLNIGCARVLVAIICTHYIVFFLWFYDSQGTKKASWTELLSRRLN
ncbi:hypothetical protein QBC37DRAFT_482344 [Rhypophila decipiens]|uniref:Uncharacterized protein n=1 Tax=Rhypophila decipiens TaxID=261697 RepID=A0AAN6YAI5_9PEZI|nr:hypothetical protein QBC37DRAFT_482344 [Rhypophila decipiens]